MKLGVNSWIWDAPFRTSQHLGLVSKIKSLGGEVIELAVEEDAEIDPPVIRRALEDAGMECSLIGLYGTERDLSVHDPAVRRRGLEYGKRCLDLCAKLGCTLYSGAVAGVGGEVVVGPAERGTRLGQAADCLHELGERAAEAGVRVCVEILNRYENNLLNTAAQGLELIRLTDHPSVGVHLDTFHMNIEELSLGDAIRLAGQDLFHLHGSESDRRTPGEGHVEWSEVGAALRDIGYDGYVVVEAFHHDSHMAPFACIWRPIAESPDALARDGLAFLRRTLSA